MIAGMEDSNKEEPMPSPAPPIPSANPPPPSGGTQTPSNDERTWALIAHLSAFAMYFSGVGHIIGPLVVWLLKRDGNPFVEDQAKEALNFQISFTIYAVAAVAVCFTIVGLVVGIPILMILPIYHIICMIIAAIKAHEGVAFRYPLTLRLIQ